MEDIFFDVDGILTGEEAEKMFDNKTEEPVETETEEQKEIAEEPEKEVQDPEKVGEEEDNETEEDAITSTDDGTSPNPYSSIASALKNDGIFPDFEDEEIEKATTPEAFAELVNKAVDARFDEKQKRVLSCLEDGMQPDTIRMYEQTLQYLGSINPEVVASETEEGENLRRQLIYNDLINRGYTQEKAQREIEKSFKSGTDIDDAKDALDALNKFYRDGYEKAQADARKEADAYKANQKKQAEEFKKLVLDDKVKIGDTELDSRTCQRVYDAVSKPVYKDPDTGRLLTAVQKFQKDKPLEFLKQLGLWYVLTEGGKNMDGFTKEQVRAEKNKAIKELSRKINTTSLSKDGSLQLMTGGNSGKDPLLSDDWKVGW